MDVDWQVKASALMEADFLVAGLCTVCEAFASDMRLWGDLATTVSQILQEIFAHKQLTAAKDGIPMLHGRQMRVVLSLNRFVFTRYPPQCN